MRTNKIPRQVPPQPWFIRHNFAVLVGGILPFGAVFIELFFYPYVHVVEPSVLHFWRLVYSFRHPVRDVRGNCNRLVLLSLVCGGLQVAVEIVLYVRELEFIRVLVFCVLFLHKSGH